jgi:hypothetical protein
VQCEKAQLRYYEWFPKAELCLTIQAVTVSWCAEALLTAAEWKLSDLKKNV